MKALAQLLPDPAKMLAALGVRPTSGVQPVTPNIIGTIVTFLTFMIALDISAFIAYLAELWFSGLDVVLQYDSAMVLPNLALITLTVVLSSGLGFFIIKAMTERRGWLASIIPFLLAVFGWSMLINIQFDLADEITTLFEESGVVDLMIGYVGLPLYFLLIGGFFVTLMAFFRWQDIRRWFPAKK